MGKQVVFTSKTTALMFLAVAGFGLLQGSRLLDQGSGPYSSQPFVIAGIVAGGACCILVALLSYFANLNDVRPVFAASLVLMAVRVAVSFLSDASLALTLVSQVSAGIGWMLILLCWMQVFVSYRPVYAVPMIAVGYILDLAIVPLVNAFFPEGRHAAYLIAIGISDVALGVCMACNRSIADDMLDDAPPHASMRELAVRAGLILYAIFIVAAPCGFIIQSDILGGLQYVQADLTALMGIAVSFVLLVLLVVFRPQKRTIDLAYPISIICLIFVLLYRVFAAGDGYVSGSMMAAFLMTFFGVFWITFVREAHERRLPAFFLLGLAVGTAQLSLAAGRITALALHNLAAVQSEQAVAICALAFLAIGICAAVTWGVHRLERVVLVPTERLEGGVPAAGEYPVARESIRADGGVEQVGRSEAEQLADTLGASGALPTVVSIAALDLLKETYGLSRREFEVVAEFSTGRSARYIADALMLSEHTIKSHLRRAYAKMDVHSRQELLSLVDQMEARIHARG